MKNILILGGGFGGLVTAERLARSLDSSHRITLVSPNAKFTFYPALVQLAFGGYEPDDIAFDLRDKLEDLKVNFVQGELLRINPERRAAKIHGENFDGEINFDYLVIASGRRLATEKTPGFFEYAHHLLGTGAALKFGEAVRNFSGGQIVVGMCPGARLPVPVCETAFALARKFEREIAEEKVRVKVIFPESLEAAFGGADLHREIESAFRRHRINVLYNVAVREFTAEEIVSFDKHRIEYDLAMFIPPFRGQANLRDLGASDAEDFIKVDGKMRVSNAEKIYAVGDIVAFSGPKFAHMAVRQAKVAAENILAEISGEVPQNEYYHEINAIIDAGDADSLHLHYGIWDEQTFSLKTGSFWSWAKTVHDRLWQARHS